MNEYDDSKKGTKNKAASNGKPRILLITFSTLAFIFAIVATVFVWLLYCPFCGIAGCVSSLLAVIVLALLIAEPDFKGKKRRAFFLLLSTVSVLLCLTSSPMGFFYNTDLTSCILLCVNTGFSGLLFVLLVLCTLLAKLKPSKTETPETIQEETSSLEVKTQDASPVHSKDRVVLLTATYNKGIGLWTSICQSFANIFGCKCKHYDKKVSIAQSEIKKSLLLEMSSYPDYDFSSFHIASDGRLSFTGSVIGVKKAD